jgi:hypothetical protein
MKILNVVIVLAMFLGTGIFVVEPVQAQSLDYTVRETIPMISGNTGVWAVQDMDGDGALDVVMFNHNYGRLYIMEWDGSSYVTRFTYNTNEWYTHGKVADIDGDGIPEIGIKTSFTGGRFYIFESSADNTYALRLYTTLGYYPETVNVGDSDNDGKLEFHIARETFPSRVHRFEATSDNVYTQLTAFTGSGGDCYLAGTADLDGDGLMETVFSDNNYRSPGYRYRGALHVYESGSQVYFDYYATLLSTSLGDLDGNGLGEIIGRDSVTNNMKILESTGTGNGFVKVYDAAPVYYWYALDVDRDGQSELWRAYDGGSGQKDIFTLAHRSGSSFTDFYNSGSLLQAYTGDIRSVSDIGDTNGDGSLEVMVIQGTNIHILEMGSSCTFECLIEEIKDAGLPKGIEQSLLAKVQAGERSHDRGNDKTASNQLGAFINEVNAQDGKHIPSNAAKGFHDTAKSIINNMRA